MGAVAATHEASDHRADGRRQHVPEPGARGQDDHHASTTSAAGGRSWVSAPRGSRPSTRPSASSSGTGPPERLRWLGEALPIMRGMLDGDGADSDRAVGTAIKAIRNDPPPIQKHLPILIGGSGPKVTLQARRAVRRHVQHRWQRRQRPRQAKRCSSSTARPIGRDEPEIERTVGHGHVPVIRDSREEAERVQTRSSSATAKAQAVGGPAGRHARGRRRATCAAFAGARLSPLHLRVPVAVRRGDDDPADDRGPAEARAGRRRRRLSLGGHLTGGAPVDKSPISASS